jgi:uncharacterized protein YcnI
VPIGLINVLLGILAYFRFFLSKIEARKSTMEKIFYVALIMTLANFHSSVAYAHASLEVKEAQKNSTYKAVMRIGHGCEGSPTKVVRIQIPEGVIKVKPKPVAGWSISIKNAEYKKTYDYHGKKINEGVREIVWSGGNLPDNYYEEFIFRARITNAFNPGETVYFPTIQECEEGEILWIQIPAENQDAHDLKRPSPSLKIVKSKQHH